MEQNCPPAVDSATSGLREKYIFILLKLLYFGVSLLHELSIYLIRSVFTEIKIKIHTLRKFYKLHVILYSNLYIF